MILSNKPVRQCADPSLTRQANTRIFVLLAVLLLGTVGSALLAYRLAKPKPVEPPAPAAAPRIILSESTKAALGRLRAPVTVRFYMLFDAATAATNLRDFASHADLLLTEFEREAGGKLSVARFTEWTTANSQSAAAEGIKPFNLAQGDPAYLGFVVTQDARTETTPQLAPEWANALEFDLVRAIARIANPAPTVRPPAVVAQDARAEETVKRTITSLPATTLEAGKQLLRDASLKEFEAGVQEMNRAVQKDEEAVRSATTDPERQAALKQLQETRAKYGDKIREVSLHLQATLEAWTRLKAQ